AISQPRRVPRTGHGGGPTVWAGDRGAPHREEYDGKWPGQTPLGELPDRHCALRSFPARTGASGRLIGGNRLCHNVFVTNVLNGSIARTLGGQCGRARTNNDSTLELVTVAATLFAP